METKNLLLTVSIALVLFFLSACNEELLDEIMNRKGLAKKAQLQEMIFEDRHYEFTYDRKGLVDRIDALERGEIIYTYEITYKNKKLFSAALVENGAVVSENHDFSFDENDNIKGFTYSWYTEDVPGGVHSVYLLGYDEQNRLVEMSVDGSISFPYYSYDNGNNISEWNNVSSKVTYTYDDKINPLNRVPDLFALLVEEHFYWEYILSAHNSVTRTETTDLHPEPQTTTFINEYDKYFRLVRKTDQGGNGFTFLYDK
jgi:hypothetical protein